MISSFPSHNFEGKFTLYLIYIVYKMHIYQPVANVE